MAAADDAIKRKERKRLRGRWFEDRCGKNATA
jgi:hypothetical protein